MLYLYQLCFARPVCPGRSTTQHYHGSTIDLAARIQFYLSGSPESESMPRLIRAIRLKGIPFIVSRVWEITERGEEYQFKRRKHGRDYCPCCNERPRQLSFAKRELSTAEIENLLIAF